MTTTASKIASHTSHTPSDATTTHVADATGSTEPITTNAGLSALVAELSQLLDTAETRLGAAPAITTTEKRRTGKPRKGSDKALTLLAPIVQQHRLESPSLNATDMLALHEKAQTLVPLQARLQKVTKRVSDEVFGAQTQSWDMGLQLYSLLRRRAKGDGELAANLEPVAKMFAFRTPETKAKKPTKVQTRAKQNLKKAVALATKHGVAVETPGTASTAGAATPAAPTAAPVSVAAAPPPASAPVAVVAAGAAGAGGAVTAASPPPATTGTNGASH